MLIDSRRVVPLGSAFIDCDRTVRRLLGDVPASRAVRGVMRLCSQKASPSSSRAALLLVAAIACFAAYPNDAETAARRLGELEVALYGMSAGLDPANPSVLRQTASRLRIVVRAGGRTQSSSEVPRLLGGSLEVQAELSGPGLAGVVSPPRTGAEAIPLPSRSSAGGKQVAAASTGRGEA